MPKSKQMKVLDFKTILTSITLLAFSAGVQAASLPITIEGEHMIRLPGSSRYIKDAFQKLPDNVIVSIPDLETASSTSAIVDGHTIKLYPGVTFKISKGTFIPLTGRFEFSPEDTATSSINIVAHNCNVGYKSGHFLIEATPDNGIFFALKDNGSVWLKDISRNVFELKSGQQIHIPMFGNAILKPRLEAFWGKEPSSFNSLGEVGQETAYGIVGSDFSNKYSKKKDTKEKDSGEEPNKEDTDSVDDEDYLDPEEEAWLNSGNELEEPEESEATEDPETLTDESEEKTEVSASTNESEQKSEALPEENL